MTDRQLIADLLSALEYHTEQTRPIEVSRVAIEAAREYLRKPAQRTWVDPNDKTQKQYLPHIGESVLFCHNGMTYMGKHTGGSFQSEATNQYFNTWECHWMYFPSAPGIKGDAA